MKKKDSIRKPRIYNKECLMFSIFSINTGKRLILRSHSSRDQFLQSINTELTQKHQDLSLINKMFRQQRKLWIPLKEQEFGQGSVQWQRVDGISLAVG